LWTGVPIYSYKGSEVNSVSEAYSVFEAIKAADQAGLVITAGSKGSGSDTMRNSCGIAMSHAFSIISAFELVENGQVWKLLLARNPWGITTYTGDWRHDDPRWTAANVAQVPLNLGT
jgi:hypothetical protein